MWIWRCLNFAFFLGLAVIVGKILAVVTDERAMQVIVPVMIAPIWWSRVDKRIRARARNS